MKGQIIMDHREFNQLIDILKSIDRNLKRIGNELMVKTAQKSNESNTTEEE